MCNVNLEAAHGKAQALVCNPTGKQQNHCKMKENCGHVTEDAVLCSSSEQGCHFM